jgi:hypothetical protein
MYATRAGNNDEAEKTSVKSLVRTGLWESWYESGVNLPWDEPEVNLPWDESEVNLPWGESSLPEANVFCVHCQSAVLRFTLRLIFCGAARFLLGVGIFCQ